MSAKAKPWWRSRVIWFNASVAATGALVAALPQLQPLLPPAAYGWVAVVLGVVNTVLRTVTNQPIASVEGHGND